MSLVDGAPQVCKGGVIRKKTVILLILACLEEYAVSASSMATVEQKWHSMCKGSFARSL